MSLYFDIIVSPIIIANWGGGSEPALIEERKAILTSASLWEVNGQGRVPTQPILSG